MWYAAAEPMPPGLARIGGAATALVVGLVVAIAIGEAIVRLADVTPAGVNAGYLQFGYATGIPAFDEDVRSEGQPGRVRLFEPDPETLWRPIPNTEYTNSRGFRGRSEYTERKTPDTFRVLFIGDSCTFVGDPNYPELVEQELDSRAGRRVECINAAVPGYSSLQGVKLLPRLHPWSPDAVVVYFGWNDQWPGQGGLTDELQFATHHGLRVLGLARAASARWRASPTSRVPLADFRRNLEIIRDAVVAWGAVPIFITAPTGFRAGAMAPWANRFFGEFYRMDAPAVAAIPAVHALYADSVRAVAATPPAVLVDAERDFAAADTGSPTLFRRDQIHLSTAGHERMAGLVAATLAWALHR